MKPPRIKKIGFFHFPTNHGDPVGSLREALKTRLKKEDIAQSLVVLPEGFNICKRYLDVGPSCDTSPEIVSDLQAIAYQFGIAFVAGLILPSNGQLYNSAHLIDPNGSLLLSYKTKDDTSANYVPWAGEGSPDLNNPVAYGNLLVAALICMDVQNDDRWNALGMRFQENTVGTSLLCIPACSGEYFSKVAIGSRDVAVASQIPARVVVANAFPRGVSYITDSSGTILKTSNYKVNEIVPTEI
ncbi:MAG TPA: nitrilase-related carbon-nitrogen hydrolase [Bryobacteraceae bacterium]|nr:nitrilase-related carbon-nitrogen hydrolase [Bryobacteraceae bacterium]